MFRPAPGFNQPRTIFGWCMYDWANSAYGCTVMMLLPMYFAEAIVGKEGLAVGGFTLKATSLWAAAVATASLMAFLSAPILGAVADFSAAKKRFLLAFAYSGSLLTLSFWFLKPTGDGAGVGDLVLIVSTLALFILAQFSFISANVFYDAFLAQIVSEERLDRVSGWGYAAGYIGGGLQFAISVLLVLLHEEFGLRQDQAVRLAMVVTGLWWAGFTLFTAFLVHEAPPVERLPEEYRRRGRFSAFARVGFRRTWETLQRVRRYRHVVLFLLAFMLYNDGIQTVINMSSVYGVDELGLQINDLIITFLIIQGVAMVGALAFGWLAGRLGTRRTIILTLVLWSAAVTYAYVINTREEFMILGIVVGLVLGGSQALSRSYYSAMVPPESSAEFFGFYTVFSKFSAIFGPVIFFGITQMTGSARYAILSVVVFFVAGIVLLLRVDEREARRARTAEAAHEGAEL